MKLHILVGCPYCSRVMFELEVLQLPYELAQYRSPTDLKTEAYLEMNPHGQAPVLEVEEGFIYESSAIMRYLGNLRPESGVNGNNNFEKAQIDIWISNGGPIFGSFARAFLAAIGKIPGDKEMIQDVIKALPEKLGSLEEHLSSRTYLVGHRATNADFCMITVLFCLFTYVLEEKERHKFPHILRYFNNLTASAFYTNVMGTSKRLCSKPFAIPPPAKEEPVEAKKSK